MQKNKSKNTNNISVGLSSVNKDIFDNNINDYSLSSAYEFFYFGDDNLMSNLLDDYLNYTPYHSVAINFKLESTIGHGVIVDNEEQLKLFNIRNSVTIDDIIYCLTFDYLMSNSLAVTLHKTLDDSHYLITPIKSYNLRVGKDINIKSLEPNSFFFSRNWKDVYDPLNTIQKYNAYKKGLDEDLMVYRWIDSINNKIYPIPNYYAALPDIKNLRNINQFNTNSIENGFSTALLVTVDNMDPDNFKKFQKNFMAAYKGPKNANRAMLLNNTSSGLNGSGIKFEYLKSDMLEGHYELLNNTSIKNILAAHQIMTPEIMGINTPGASLGGDVNKIRESYKLFEDKILSNIRIKILKQVNKLLEIGNWGFKIVSFDIPTDALNDNGVSGNNSSLDGTNNMNK